MKTGLLLSIAALCTAVLQGCNAAGCTDNKSSLPLAGFYSYQTLQPVTINDISVGAVGAPNDSLLLEKGSAARLYMPFNIGKNSTTYFIRYTAEGLDDPRYFDTITFNYNRVPYFASEECGAMYSYEITSVTNTSHRIDSLAITRPFINNADRESIQIYFNTSTPDNNEEPQQ